MKQIRLGVFETNSSSTHSICISKEMPERFPSKIHFRMDYFGWRCDEVDPADYLYAMLYCSEDFEELLDELKKILDKHKIKYSFEEPHDEHDCDFGIDHSADAIDIARMLLDDEDMLLRYLFGDSYVYTGNDNCDSTMECYKKCRSADPSIEYYDRDTQNWITEPNPYYDPEHYDYFEKGN